METMVPRPPKPRAPLRSMQSAVRRNYAAPRRPATPRPLGSTLAPRPPSKPAGANPLPTGPYLRLTRGLPSPVQQRVRSMPAADSENPWWRHLLNAGDAGVQALLNAVSNRADYGTGNVIRQQLGEAGQDFMRDLNAVPRFDPYDDIVRFQDWIKDIVYGKGK